MILRVAGITEDSIVDGPGLRLVVFTQGCPHHCPGCHNPETWPFDGGYTVDTSEIIAMMDANPLLSGITLSGGEPFLQAGACIELANAAHERGLSVWCYTGYTFETLFGVHRICPDKLLTSIDVLVDGPFELSQRTLELPWRGSKNQRLINVPESLERGCVVEVQGSR